MLHYNIRARRARTSLVVYLMLSLSQLRTKESGYQPRKPGAPRWERVALVISQSIPNVLACGETDIYMNCSTEYGTANGTPSSYLKGLLKVRVVSLGLCVALGNSRPNLRIPLQPSLYHDNFTLSTPHQCHKLGNCA